MRVGFETSEAYHRIQVMAAVECLPGWRFFRRVRVLGAARESACPALGRAGERNA